MYELISGLILEVSFYIVKFTINNGQVRPTLPIYMQTNSTGPYGQSMIFSELYSEM
jgi:hypothetical protein